MTALTQPWPAPPAFCARQHSAWHLHEHRTRRGAFAVRLMSSCLMIPSQQDILGDPPGQSIRSRQGSGASGAARHAGKLTHFCKHAVADVQPPLSPPAGTPTISAPPAGGGEQTGEKAARCEPENSSSPHPVGGQRDSRPHDAAPLHTHLCLQGAVCKREGCLQRCLLTPPTSSV